MSVDLSRDLSAEEMAEIIKWPKDPHGDESYIHGAPTNPSASKSYPILPFYFSQTGIGKTETGYAAYKRYEVLLVETGSSLLYNEQGKRRVETNRFIFFPLFKTVNTTSLATGATISHEFGIFPLPFIGSMFSFGRTPNGPIYSIFFIPLGSGWD